VRLGFGGSSGTASATPTNGTATNTTAPSTRPGTRPWTAAMTAAARPAPASATAAVTSGAPPSGANQRSGESAWLNAHRPHGKPPNGNRSRSASSVTQAAAVHNGAQRIRPRTVSAAPRRAMKAASANGNSSHTSPTYTPLHERSGPKNAHPHR
jgi:hypothetical protein